MESLVDKKRKEIQNNILKSFGVDIEKALSGVYEDNVENRKLGRVGQKYGKDNKSADEPQYEIDRILGKIKNSSTESLKRLLKNPNIKNSVFEYPAINELKSRGEFNADDYERTKKTNKESKGAKGIAEKLFELEDSYYGETKTTSEVKSAMQKIISDNNLSKNDFVKMYVKYGKNSGGGGILSSDLKESASSSIKTFGLKFN